MESRSRGRQKRGCFSLDLGMSEGLRARGLFPPPPGGGSAIFSLPHKGGGSGKTSSRADAAPLAQIERNTQKRKIAHPKSSKSFHWGGLRKQQPTTHVLPSGRHERISIASHGAVWGALRGRTFRIVPSQRGSSTFRHRPPIERSTTQPNRGVSLVSSVR